MTLEELKKLKPSLDNRVKLECNNGMYKRDLMKVIVIGITPHSSINIVNNSGELQSIGEYVLTNLEPPSPGRELIELAHFYDAFGVIRLLTCDGKKCVNLQERKTQHVLGYYRRCTGIKNIFIYEDDFSIVEER